MFISADFLLFIRFFIYNKNILNITKYGIDLERH